MSSRFRPEDLHTILEGISDAIVTLDDDLSYIAINRAGRNIPGTRTPARADDWEVAMAGLPRGQGDNSRAGIDAPHRIANPRQVRSVLSTCQKMV